MDKTHTEFVQEFEAELAALKSRLQALEEELARYREVLENQPEEPGEPVPQEDAAEPVEAAQEDFPVDFTEEEIGNVEAPAGDYPQVDAIPEEGSEAIDVDVEMELPPLPDAPAPDVAEEPVSADVPGAGDADETAGLPWRTDKPGLPVKNIRSGISLYDRALFIGTLFKEDYALYDATIQDLNACTSLDQAVDYIRNQFPSWNLHSDVVYNFMMAIRKKLG